MSSPSTGPRSAKAERLRVILGRPEVLHLRDDVDASAPEPPPHHNSSSGIPLGSISIVSGEPQPESKMAVLVCHGMGQQVAFETLDSVAQAIAASAGAHEVTVRHVRAGDKRLPRAEVMVNDADGRPRGVHVYESYWAPLMEGRVTARDVTRFLFSAGFSGLRHALAGSFDRWMFGRKRTLAISPAAPFLLLLAFAFIASGLTLYAVLGFVAVAQAGEFMFLPRDGSWNGGALVEALAFELFRSPLALSLVLTPVMLWASQRPTASRAPVRAGTWAARAAMSLLVLGAVWGVLVWSAPGTGAVARVNVEAWLRSNWAWVGGAVALLAVLGGAAMVLARRGRLGPPLATLMGVVVAWTLLSAVRMGGRLRQWVDGDLGAGWSSGLRDWEQMLAGGVDAPFYLIFLFCAVLLCVKVRWFYVQYFGDVAAYLSSHTVNKFHEVRSQIRALGLETARAVYGARRRDSQAPEYDRVLVVGHSLGSVVAYDTLNSILNEDATGAGLDALGRTQSLITFGSPLDRTAFIFRTLVKDAEGREALAAGNQPLIHPVAGNGRTTAWYNIYSPYDPISSALRFYDPPKADEDVPSGHQRVANISDPDANIPAVAHTQYWKNPALSGLLLSQVKATIPSNLTANVEPANV